MRTTTFWLGGHYRQVTLYKNCYVNITILRNRIESAFLTLLSIFSISILTCHINYCQVNLNSIAYLTHNHTSQGFTNETALLPGTIETLVGATEIVICPQGNSKFHIRSCITGIQ